MNRCRNCDGANLQELGFTGRLAPFFLKRVFGVRLGVPSSSHPAKRWVQKLFSIPQAWLHRVSRPSAFVEMQICSDCSFVQTKMPFEETSINRLYMDYRAESYNRERVEYEPAYAKIAEEVGQAAVEIEGRVAAATKFIQQSVQGGPKFTILDFGGADGKFLPRLEGKKFVFEISNIPPIEGVTRLHTEDEMGTYSLVQLTHVIEHVVQPLGLVKHVASKVEPGGYLYIEVPQEISDQDRAALKSGKSQRVIDIHEHINSYCIDAVTKLIEGARLRLVAIEAGTMDVGWAKAVHIRALGQK